MTVVMLATLAFGIKLQFQTRGAKGIAVLHHLPRTDLMCDNQPAVHYVSERGAGAQNSTTSSLNVTVLVMSEGHRVQELTQILSYYLFEYPANVHVTQLHVVWNNASCIPISREILQHEKIIIHRESTNTLNNRYKHWRLIETEAVLLLDDDVFVADLRSALMIHKQKRFRDRLITFYARTHQFNGSNGISYLSPKSLNGSYSFGTGQATLLSTKWIQSFQTDKRLRRIREFVDNNRPTCEDMALHMYASNISGQPPLLISAGQTEIHFSSRPAMSSSKGWFDKRKQCLNDFVERDFQGKMPLVYSEYKTAVTLQEILSVSSATNFHEPNTLNSVSESCPFFKGNLEYVKLFKEGATGKVFEMRDGSVVKHVGRSADSDMMFEREIAAHQYLQSRNLTWIAPKLLQVDPRSRCIRMEHAGAKAPLNTSAELEQINIIVDAMREVGFSHNDLSLEEVRVGVDGRLRVFDFGWSSLVAENGTHDYSFGGKVTKIKPFSFKDCEIVLQIK